MTFNVLQRFLSPNRNVGGGDLVTRLMATLGLVLLTAVVLPQTQVPYPLMKISLLVASELGLIGLMLGMFLKSKTYFAGFQLFLASLIMLWLASHQLVYVSAGIGALFIGGGIAELVTRRSRLNALLGLSSFRESKTETTLLEQALLPEASGAALEPTPHGATR